MKMKLLSLAIALASAAALPVAHADTFGKMTTTLSKSSISLYTAGGTTGSGVGVALKLPQANVVFRSDYTGANLSGNKTEASNNYDYKFKSHRALIAMDMHPYRNDIAFTVGLSIGQSNVDANANLQGSSYVLNGNTYTAGPGDYVHAKISQPSVMPYFGLGLNNFADTDKGMAYFVDLGVTVGKPNVTLEVSPALAAAAGSDVAAEQAAVQDKANKYRVTPVLKAGLGYRF